MEKLGLETKLGRNLTAPKQNYCTKTHLDATCMKINCLQNK